MGALLSVAAPDVGVQDGMVAGDFYADPPAVSLREDSAANFEAKRAFEADRLTAWFGA